MIFSANLVETLFHECNLNGLCIRHSRRYPCHGWVCEGSIMAVAAVGTVVALLVVVVVLQQFVLTILA